MANQNQKMKLLTLMQILLEQTDEKHILSAADLCKELEKYDIKAANFKSYTGEIDLIAIKDGVLCIIEVKTRKVGGMLPPAEAVDARKQANIKSCAAVYINKYASPDTKVRYDIIEVLLDSENEKQYKINHIKDAF
jgi:putative endonuclease